MASVAREVFDSHTFLRSIDGNVGLFTELARLFVQECPARLASVRAALERHDSAALESSAHLLTGSAGYFCATKAYHAALSVEQAARAGDLATARKACVALEREVTLLREALVAAGLNGSSRSRN